MNPRAQQQIQDAAATDTCMCGAQGGADVHVNTYMGNTRTCANNDADVAANVGIGKCEYTQKLVSIGVCMVLVQGAVLKSVYNYEDRLQYN